LRNQISSLRVPSGVVVLGRAADLITPDTGLQTGDVIHALNPTPIGSMDALRSAVLALKTGDPVVLQVERSDGLTYLGFEME
jgi:serine protease Do